MSDQQITARVTVNRTSFGIVRVTGSSNFGVFGVPGTTSFGTIRVTGGVPGPPGTDGTVLVSNHVVDPDPHPAYDDMPTLTLLFENGLV